MKLCWEHMVDDLTCASSVPVNGEAAARSSAGANEASRAKTSRKFHVCRAWIEAYCVTANQQLRPWDVLVACLAVCLPE